MPRESNGPDMTYRRIGIQRQRYKVLNLFGAENGFGIGCLELDTDYVVLV
jgi:hypothetical protein